MTLLQGMWTDHHAVNGMHIVERGDGEEVMGAAEFFRKVAEACTTPKMSCYLVWLRERSGSRGCHPEGSTMRNLTKFRHDGAPET